MSKEDMVSGIKTLLGNGTKFKGVLTFEGTVRIDGEMEGEIISKDILIVGEEASLSTDIQVGSIIVNGQVTGNIRAENKVEIKENGIVIGNIKTPAIVIENGGLIDGHCEMMKKKEKKQNISSKENVSTKRDGDETSQ